MEVLGSTKYNINKDENGEIALHLEVNEQLLVDCNIVNNNYPQNSRVLNAEFVPNVAFV